MERGLRLYRVGVLGAGATVALSARRRRSPDELQPALVQVFGLASVGTTSCDSATFTISCDNAT